MEYLEEIDFKKARHLANSLLRVGWQGPPIVVDGLFIINGHHRHYAATAILGWVEERIPTIDIRDIFERVGMNWDRTIQEVDGDYHRAVSKLPSHLWQEYFSE